MVNFSDKVSHLRGKRGVMEQHILLPVVAFIINDANISPFQIEEVFEPLSPHDFFTKYVIPERPVIMKGK